MCKGVDYSNAVYEIVKTAEEEENILKIKTRFNASGYTAKLKNSKEVLVKYQSIW